MATQASSGNITICWRRSPVLKWLSGWLQRLEETELLVVRGRLVRLSTNPVGRQYNDQTRSFTKCGVHPFLGSLWFNKSSFYRLFGNLLEATDILHLLYSKTDIWREIVEGQGSATSSITRDKGFFMGRIEYFTESDSGHHHMSPVYGLYPGSQITPQYKETWNEPACLVERTVLYNWWRWWEEKEDSEEESFKITVDFLSFEICPKNFL